MKLDRAIAIAATEFEGVYDNAGNPYILHCLHVMNQVKKYGEQLMIAAVLHDLIEDTKWTFEDLEKEGLDSVVIDTIRLLTHDENVSYGDYIKEISTSKLASIIKMADLRYNSDIARMKGSRDKDFERLIKYHKSYEFLKNLHGEP